MFKDSSNGCTNSYCTCVGTRTFKDGICETCGGVAAGHAFTGTPEMVGNVVFTCGSTGEVMRLDKDGMIYKGQRIEDGGEAYKAFMEAMGMLKAARGN